MTSRLFAIAVCFFLLASATAQEIFITPKPVSAVAGKGTFVVKPDAGIKTSAATMKSATFLKDYLSKMYGVSTNLITGKGKADIELKVVAKNNAIKGAYHMSVNGKHISIVGDDEEGVFYGVQSLIQLLPVQKTGTVSVPAVEVKDAPRFAYRGAHLDVGRHFFDADFIKKYIDLLAMYKLNVFHWHLTEDQGWRIEIKRYPELTQIGSKRNGEIIGHYPGQGNDNKPTGGYYTQEQVKDIVAYAAARYITVIPEIEMPGHGSAAIAAYPSLSCFPKRFTPLPINMVSMESVRQAQQENKIKFVQETWGVHDDVFCAGKDSTFIFLQNVLDEIIPLFPAKYIHIGGDECPKSNWKQCPLCQKRMKENNLKDEHALQSYFIERMEKYINSKGKSIIGWDEILEGGLAPNATVMSWRGEQGGIEAAKQHHEVIMTPGGTCYFDHSNSKNEDSLTIGGLLPIETVYGYNPVPPALSAEEGKYIIGVQANLWTEYMSNPAKVEYMLLPRLSAMSEVQWTAPENKSWSDFQPRLLHEFKKYDWMGLNYCPVYLKENKQ
jgi:hexosaminidase